MFRYTLGMRARNANPLTGAIAGKWGKSTPPERPPVASLALTEMVGVHEDSQLWRVQRLGAERGSDGLRPVGSVFGFHAPPSRADE